MFPYVLWGEHFSHDVLSPVQRPVHIAAEINPQTKRLFGVLEEGAELIIRVEGQHASEELILHHFAHFLGSSQPLIHLRHVA